MRRPLRSTKTRVQITVGSGVVFDPALQSEYTVTVEARDRDLAHADVEVKIAAVERLHARTTGGGGGGGGGGPPPVPIPSDKDFDWNVTCDNDLPTGLWSDGDVIYVADEQDDKVYSYNLPDATIAQLASLSLSELELGEFSPLRSDYASVAPVGVATTTITALATQNEAGIEIQPDDADADTGNGHQVAIMDAGQFSITVTSADASRSSVYRVQIQRCVSGLTQDRLSTVHYAGGSVDELVACARSLGAEALYHQRDGVWVGWFLAGPELINRYFRQRFREGLPAGLQLVPKLDEVQSSRPGSANDN